MKRERRELQEGARESAHTQIACRPASSGGRVGDGFGATLTSSTPPSRARRPWRAARSPLLLLPLPPSRILLRFSLLPRTLFSLERFLLEALTLGFRCCCLARHKVLVVLRE